MAALSLAVRTRKTDPYAALLGLPGAPEVWPFLTAEAYAAAEGQLR